MQEKFGYRNVYLVCSKHGHVMYSNNQNNDLGENLKYGYLKESPLARIWKKTLESKKFEFRDYEIYQENDFLPTAFLSVPFLNSGEVEGVLVVQLNKNKLNEIINNTSGLGKTGFSFLLGQDQKFKTDVKNTFIDINKSYDKNWRLEASVDQSFLSTLNKATGNELIASLLENGQDLVSWKEFDFFDYKWKIYSVITEKEASLEAKNLLIMNLWTVSIVLVCILFISFFVAKRITKQLKIVVKQTRKVAAGYLITIPKMENEDEVGQVSNSLSEMIFSLKKFIGVVKINANHLASSSDELSITSRGMNQETSKIQNEIGRVKETVQMMSSSIHTMAVASEQMSVNTNQVSNFSNNISENMKIVLAEMNELLNSMSGIDEESSRAVNISREALSTSSHAIEEMLKLESISKEIGSVTELIKRIAEQTNLLALNASIEAASAGEAGKGFAVVANEVKQLALQSASAADQVRFKIKSVQVAAEDSLVVIQNVARVVEMIHSSSEQVSLAINEQKNSTDNISEKIQTATSSVEKINDNIKELVNGIREVSTNSSATEKNIHTLDSKMKLLVEQIYHINSGANQVELSSQELSKMSSELIQEINFFKEDDL